MFRGLTTLNLDDKGRLAIPKVHRVTLMRQCDGQMVVTVDRHDPCLMLYPLPEWEEIEHKLVKLPTFNKHARNLQRILLGYAVECEFDKSGRILLSQELRDYAKLDKEIVMVGQGHRFEIWNAATWNTHRLGWIAESSDEDGKLPGDFESLSL